MNAIKVINISELFFECENLIQLPDISKLETNNITNMDKVFYNCKSLKSLPDISKWNTNSVQSMEKIFYNCESLKELMLLICQVHLNIAHH